MNGKVKWYNKAKGFGFIEGEDGQDYFVHYTALDEGFVIKDNDEITFEPVETEKGKQAKEIALK